MRVAMIAMALCLAAVPVFAAAENAKETAPEGILNCRVVALSVEKIKLADEDGTMKRASNFSIRAKNIDEVKALAERLIGVEHTAGVIKCVDLADKEYKAKFGGGY